MNINQIIRVVVLAVIAPLMDPSSLVVAQETASFMPASPQIVRFELDAPIRLVAGETLIFRIAGSPDGTASIRIDGVKGKITLREVRAGVYEGAYTITQADRIDADSIVMGVLRVGNRERSTVLAQPLVETFPVVAWRR